MIIKKKIKQKATVEKEYRIEKLVFNMSGTESYITLMMADRRENINVKYDRENIDHLELDKAVENFIRKTIE